MRTEQRIEGLFGTYTNASQNLVVDIPEKAKDDLTLETTGDQSLGRVNGWHFWDIWWIEVVAEVQDLMLVDRILVAVVVVNRISSALLFEN